MVELTTLGHVIKIIYEEEPDTNALDDARLAMLLQAMPKSARGSALGVAELDASGMIPVNRLNVSGLAFQGAWNPVTNTPTLVDGTGTAGQFYKADRQGEHNFGNGTYQFNLGDWVIFAGGTWQRIGVSDSVGSVNGMMGDVVLTAADVGALPATYVPPAAPVQSVNGRTGAITLTAADVGAMPSGSAPEAPVQSVNGQTGEVVLDAESVGARSSTWVPAWDDVTDKPTLGGGAQHRGSISPAIAACRRTVSGSQAAPNGAYAKITSLGGGYDQFGIYNAGVFKPPAWATHIRITSCMILDSMAGGGVFLAVLRNGSMTSRASAPTLSGSAACTVDTGVLPCTSADSFELQLWQNSGTLRYVLANHSWVMVELFESTAA